MRIVVLANGPFAVPTCEQLWKVGHEVSLVVVRPTIGGPSKKLPPAPVRDWAASHNLPIIDPASANDPATISRLADQHADLLFVCDFGQILSKECLSATRLGGINLHGSLLPRHRGAAPVQWTLLSGDTMAGVSVIHITPKLDGGPVLTTSSTEVLPDEDAGQLEVRLSQLGVAPSLEAIELLSKWNEVSVIGQVQDRAAVTKAPRFNKADGQLDFRKSAEELVRQIRALQPWPGTFAELQWPDGKSIRLLIRSARSTSGALSAQSPGEAWAVDTKSLHELKGDWSGDWERVIAVATASGTLLVSRVQPAGKREMAAAEFMRGHPLTNHPRFVLPS